MYIFKNTVNFMIKHYLTLYLINLINVLDVSKTLQSSTVSSYISQQELSSLCFDSK